MYSTNFVGCLIRKGTSKATVEADALNSTSVSNVKTPTDYAEPFVHIAHTPGIGVAALAAVSWRCCNASFSWTTHIF